MCDLMLDLGSKVIMFEVRTIKQLVLNSNSFFSSNKSELKGP